MGIFYESTRGRAPELDLRAAALTGLATDGGLYVPKTFPTFGDSFVDDLRDMSYTDVAFAVMRPFALGVLPDDVLRKIIAEAYAPFADKDVTPLPKLGDGHYVLELFHGPTLAFKDLALQFLGGTFEYFLTQAKQRMTVVGATSGDTGSAAIAALAGRAHVDVFILYPQKGPSEIQRKQMTCVDAANIHAIAVDGTFDDCQRIVKELFADTVFRDRHNLGAVNSINWLRILAQMVYYFYAVSRLSGDDAHRAPSFVVPTGNFGNIYAGYAAYKCGLPVSKLAVASNSNDILTRFFASGRMQTEAVIPTLSPSMDIQISSNFERLLFDLNQRDGSKVVDCTEVLKQKHAYTLPPMQLGVARQVFTAAKADDNETLAAIRAVYEQHNYILDPHSAVGAVAAKKLVRELPQPVINLACAHPAKFPDTIETAIGIRPELPGAMAALMQKPERGTALPAQISPVKTFIEERVKL